MSLQSFLFLFQLTTTARVLLEYCSVVCEKGLSGVAAARSFVLLPCQPPAGGASICHDRLMSVRLALSRSRVTLTSQQQQTAAAAALACMPARSKHIGCTSDAGRQRPCVLPLRWLPREIRTMTREVHGAAPIERERGAWRACPLFPRCLFCHRSVVSATHAHAAASASAAAAAFCLLDLPPLSLAQPGLRTPHGSKATDDNDRGGRGHNEEERRSVPRLRTAHTVEVEKREEAEALAAGDA